MKTNLSRLWGNEAVRNLLHARLEDDSVSHAYLIAGPTGSGKKTLAFLLCAALCCESGDTRPCFHCPSCRKILSGQSPDLVTLGLEKLPFAAEVSPTNVPDAPIPEDIPTPEAGAVPKSIGVDAVRALQADVYILPNDLERKLYIIGHADRMTVQAQNALLKILEEPPSSVVFLLLCETPAALLPTIRSRVQTLTMERFDDDTLYAYLTAGDREAKVLASRDPEKLRLFVRLSGGTVGGVRRYLAADAKTLSADPVYEAHETAARCLSIVFADEMKNDSPVLSGTALKPRKTELYSLLTTRAGTREQLRALLDALGEAVRDITVCACTAEEDGIRPLFFADTAQPAAHAMSVSPTDLVSVSAELAAARASLDANPNVTLLQSRIAGILMRLRYR